MEVLALYTSRYGTQLPINPEKLLETEYGVQIIPIRGLRALGIECAFSRGGSTILVDQDDYEDESKANRLAFTFAHELGHKVLHTEYINVVERLTNQEVDWLEQQARMFAAHFLMPEPVVLGVIASEISERLSSIVKSELTFEACIGYRVANLANYFGVSPDAMTNRIKNINLDEVLDGPYISEADKERLAELASTVEKVGKSRWAVRHDPVVT